MIDAPVRDYFRRVGSAILSASIVAALLISAGVAATLILFAPVARAQPSSSTINTEYTMSIAYRPVEVEQN